MTPQQCWAQWARAESEKVDRRVLPANSGADRVACTELSVVDGVRIVTVTVTVVEAHGQGVAILLLPGVDELEERVDVGTGVDTLKHGEKRREGSNLASGAQTNSILPSLLLLVEVSRGGQDQLPSAVAETGQKTSVRTTRKPPRPFNPCTCGGGWPSARGPWPLFRKGARRE